MNTSIITYKVFSKKEVRAWLIKKEQNGLSGYAIAPTRAFALINNPCAIDIDPVIVVAYDGEKPIGYSAVFADDYVKGNVKGRFFWGTTEWIEPGYRGKGIAAKMMRTLKEATGLERYIGLESSIASVRLDQKQGASIVYFDKTKFHFVSKGSLRTYLLTKYVTCHNRKQLNKLKDFEFQNEYVNFIDAETYRFVEAHSQNNLFLRQREMLNWMLQYPFLIGTHNDINAKKDVCEFGSTVLEYNIEAVKVYVHNDLVGVYVVSQTNKERTLRYFYYDECGKNEVMASVTINLLRQGIEKIFFVSDELREFMHLHGIKHLNRKSYIEKVALTLPPNMSIDQKLHIQGGDGDMFC